MLLGCRFCHDQNTWLVLIGLGFYWLNVGAWECPVPSRQLQVLLRPDTVRYGVHSVILRDGGPDIDVDREEMMQEQIWLLMTILNCLVIVAGKDLDRMVGANRTDIGIPMGNSEIDAPKKL